MASMNGFHTPWRRMSAHESASTIGKKTANWTVGKTMRAVRVYRTRGGRNLAKRPAAQPR